MGLAALCAAAVCAAPASAQDWRAAGNAICSDYYDGAALAAGELDSPAAAPDYLTAMARLTERKDAGLARLRPPAAHAPALGRLLAHDRRTATTLRAAASALRGGRSIKRLATLYDRDLRAVRAIARGLGLRACAGEGVVTGPAEEL